MNLSFAGVVVTQPDETLVSEKIAAGAYAETAATQQNGRFHSPSSCSVIGCSGWPRTVSRTATTTCCSIR